MMTQEEVRMPDEKNPLVSTPTQILEMMADMARQQQATAAMLGQVAKQLQLAQGTQSSPVVEDIRKTDQIPIAAPVPAAPTVVSAPPVKSPRGPGRPKGSGKQHIPPPGHTTAPAPAPPPPPPPPTQPLIDPIKELRLKIQVALMRESLDVPKLAKTIGVTASRMDILVEVVNTLRTEHWIYNVGLEERPKWTWRVGDDADRSIKIEVVKKLISERPMSSSDLMLATGIYNAKVLGGIIVDLQRAHRVLDLSPDGRSNIYLLVGDHLRDVSLPKKVFKKAKTRDKK